MSKNASGIGVVLRLHDRGGVLGAEEVARVVDAGHEIERLLFQLHQAARLGDAGVGDQQVEPAADASTVRRTMWATLSSSVTSTSTAWARAPSAAATARRARQVEVGDDDHRALGVQRLGDAPAEALRRAGDHGDLARQPPLTCGAVVDVLAGESAATLLMSNMGIDLRSSFGSRSGPRHSAAMRRPIRTPIALAIISPRVQPLESPRQCSPRMEVLKSASILTRLE